MIEYYSLNAESSVVGSILIDESCLKDVRDVITADDFLIDKYKNIFIAACHLQDDSKPVDPITILEETGVNKTLVMELMQTTPTPDNVLYYAKIVRDASAERKIVDALDDSKHTIQSQEEDASTVAMRLSDQLTNIVEEQTKGDLVTSEELCDRFYNNIGRGKQRVPTYFPELDNILGGGFVKKGLYILAARPGCGKTSLAINIAEHVAKSGGGVCFITLEMEDEQLQARRTASETRIPYAKFETGDLTKDEWRQLTCVLDKQSKRNIQYNLKPSCTLSEIETLARKIKGIDLLVIDYLQLIRYKGTSKTMYEKVTDISNELKRMSRRLGIPILCLSQLNRESESRNDKLPKMSDLRDSGAIEQDADGIILLGNKETQEDPNAPRFVTAIVAKNRHGQTGKTNYAFYGNTCIFYSIKEDT